MWGNSDSYSDLIFKIIIFFTTECWMWNLPQNDAKTKLTSSCKNAWRVCWFAMQGLWQKIFNNWWKKSTRKDTYGRQTVWMFILWKSLCSKSQHAGMCLWMLTLIILSIKIKQLLNVFIIHLIHKTYCIIGTRKNSYRRKTIYLQVLWRRFRTRNKTKSASSWL